MFGIKRYLIFEDKFSPVQDNIIVCLLVFPPPALEKQKNNINYNIQ